MSQELAPVQTPMSPWSLDGFGTRSRGADPESGDAVELLDVEPGLVEHAGFVAALGDRVARSATVRHTSYVHLRRLDRPSPDRLVLVSDDTPGWRLSDLLRMAVERGLAPEFTVVIGILRQLIPAVSLFSRHNRDTAIGTLSPERLVLTPQSRVVIAEHAFGSAIEKLNLGRDRLWRQYRAAMPPSAGLPRANARADANAIGIVALQLLLGRRLEDDEYPSAIPSLVESAVERRGGRQEPLSASFAQWLKAALQHDVRTAYQAPHELQVAFETVLISDRTYVTTPRALDEWVRAAGAALDEVMAARLAEIDREAERAAAAAQKAERPAAAGSEPASTPDPSASGVVELVEVVERTSRSESAESAQAWTPAVAHPAYKHEHLSSPPPSPSEPGGPAAVDPAEEPVLAPGGPARVDPEPVTSVEPVRLAEPVEPVSRIEPVERVGPAAPSSRLPLILGGVIAVLVAVIAYLVLRPPPPPLAGEGELVVESRPAGAKVSIDGTPRGVTPLTMPIASGAHVLEIQVGSTEPRVIPLAIRAGVQTAQYVEMQGVPATGRLEVKSDPPGARVVVDGQMRGTTPLVLGELAAGDHEVVLTLGTRTAAHKVTVETGGTAQLVVPLPRR